jgi:DNA recombination protein RmuC
MEDYERMMDAVEKSDADAMAAASHALELRVVSQAKSIRDKYINPPMTTDFAVLFVPLESLFAEILRRPGLNERLQQEYRVTVAGPTTLASLLNSLRMGFRTLAIQKSSSEVWKLLGAVKKQFGAFAESLEAIDKNIERAAKGVREVTARTGIIQRRLERVEELPEHEAARLLPGSGTILSAEEDAVG